MTTEKTLFVQDYHVFIKFILSFYLDVQKKDTIRVVQ